MSASPQSDARARIDAYYTAWNAHDADAVAALFAPGGTYEDPTSAGPLAGAALSDCVRARVALLPDLAFERAPGTALEGANRSAVEWSLRGTNRGPWAPGVGATGATVALRGVDVFALGADGALASVRSYFDQKALVEQLGLMALVQPVEQGAAKYGYSMRLPSGNPRPPGVIALTWIQGRDESERERIRAHSRANVQDFVREPGFVGIVTGFTGLRGFTVTAWEDEAALRRGLSGHHATAMRELRTERFVHSVWTSVWAPTRMNRLWLRCTSCDALEDASDDHRACSRCGAALPERPLYW